MAKSQVAYHRALILEVAVLIFGNQKYNRPVHLKTSTEYASNIRPVYKSIHLLSQTVYLAFVFKLDYISYIVQLVSALIYLAVGMWADS
jgi:hypothetical protein